MKRNFFTSLLAVVLFLGVVFGAASTKVPLPYSKSYSCDYIGIEGKTYIGFYTGYIKCDFQLGIPSTVAFYIEASDLERVDDYFEDREFQVC